MVKGGVLLMCNLSLSISEKCCKVEFPKFYVTAANLSYNKLYKISMM